MCAKSKKKKKKPVEDVDDDETVMVVFEHVPVCIHCGGKTRYVKTEKSERSFCPKCKVVVAQLSA
jgi:hypothetical protein